MSFNSPGVLLQPPSIDIILKIFVPFNSPGVLLQLDYPAYLFEKGAPLSILLESYCNESRRVDVDVDSLDFQFSWSLIATRL